MVIATHALLRLTQMKIVLSALLIVVISRESSSRTMENATPVKTTLTQIVMLNNV